MSQEKSQLPPSPKQAKQKQLAQSGTEPVPYLPELLSADYAQDGSCPWGRMGRQGVTSWVESNVLYLVQGIGDMRVNTLRSHGPNEDQ